MLSAFVCIPFTSIHAWPHATCTLHATCNMYTACGHMQPLCICSMCILHATCSLYAHAYTACHMQHVHCIGHLHAHAACTLPHAAYSCMSRPHVAYTQQTTKLSRRNHNRYPISSFLIKLCIHYFTSLSTSSQICSNRANIVHNF